MAVDIFMKIEGIDGESTDDGHPKWFELESANSGVSQPVSGASATGGRTGGRADFQDICVVKTVDNATPDIYIYCATGKHIPKIELEFCLATEEKHCFHKCTIEDCIVTSITCGGTSQDETKPLETVCFAYGKIKWEYTPIGNDGKPGSTTERAWDLEKNKKV